VGGGRLRKAALVFPLKPRAQMISRLTTMMMMPGIGEPRNDGPVVT
jgi:hypothetical protein